MEDIIYKRDAIHAVYKEWQGCSKKYGGYDIIYDTTEAIEKIKPAENVKEVIYCKDCKHRSGVTCPMYFEEYYEYDDDGYLENDYIIHDNTVDDGFVTVEKGKIMNNAEKFKQLFGLYATELWSKSEKDFLTWLNMEYVPDTNVGELISRQAAIDALKKGLSKIPYMNNTDEDMIRRDERIGCIQEVRALPSTQPRKGKWTYRSGKPATIGKSYAVICSKCNEWFEYCTNFCPNCGCRMEEGDAE